MTKIITLLSGGNGFWIMFAALLAASVAGAAGGWTGRGLIDAPALSREQTATATREKETQTCIAQAEKNRADGNAKTVHALQADIQRLTGVIDTLEAQRKARDADTDRFLKALANAPKTFLCAGSPAERAYRDSVQPRTPAVAP